MSPNARRFVLAVSLAAATATAACSAPAEDTGDAVDEAISTEGDFYGNDRVGAVLKGHPEKVPASLDAYDSGQKSLSMKVVVGAEYESRRAEHTASMRRRTFDGWIA